MSSGGSGGGGGSGGSGNSSLNLDKLRAGLQNAMAKPNVNGAVPQQPKKPVHNHAAKKPVHNHAAKKPVHKHAAKKPVHNHSQQRKKEGDAGASSMNLDRLRLGLKEAMNGSSSASSSPKKQSGQAKTEWKTVLNVTKQQASSKNTKKSQPQQQQQRQNRKSNKSSTGTSTTTSSTTTNSNSNTGKGAKTLHPFWDGPSSRSVASAGSQHGACHYSESSECAHVSINEVACYRTERTLIVVLPTPLLTWASAPRQCPQATEKRSGCVINIVGRDESLILSDVPFHSLAHLVLFQNEKKCNGGWGALDCQEQFSRIRQKRTKVN